MIRSMTGFGREQRIVDGIDIAVEIRSVNHRYNEFHARLPRHYAFLEEKLKGLIGGKISRGKVEVYVTVHTLQGTSVKVTANQQLVESYLTELNRLQEEVRIAGDLTLADVLRIPEAFTVVKCEENEDAVWEAVGDIASAALDKFVKMREIEGAKMYTDIVGRLDFIADATTKIEMLTPKATEKYRAKLFDKMNEIISRGIDEQRILLEAAIFAEKVAVDEETVRLKSHISQTRKLLKNESVVGRKLDFIVQEMNREINTIGSKANEIEITRIVVDLKSELEKIREQIQNIE